MKRHLEPRDKLDFRTLGKLYAKLSQDAPEAGFSIAQWSESVSVEFGVTPEVALEVAARFYEYEKFKNDGRRYTESQRVAMLLGHTKGEVIRRLGEMLYATKSELIYRQTKEGKFVEMDENGDPMVHEQPDWKAVGDACKQLNQIHGSFAPDQLVVDMNQRLEVTHTETREALLERWNKLPEPVRRALAPGLSGGAPVSRRIDGPGSHPETVVLDASLHQNQG